MYIVIVTFFHNRGYYFREFHFELCFINDSLGDKVDLLWTNENPNSPFSPQTINLDLSKYKMVAIALMDFKEDRQRGMSFCLVGSSSQISVLWDRYYYRNVTVNISNIYFGDGYTSASHTQINNDTAIPVHIYGIK